MSLRTADTVLAQILTCLDDAAARPGLVKASVHQTEGYLRGLQGMAWEKPANVQPDGSPASVFIADVRQGAIALRGRIKEGARPAMKAFLKGLVGSFPGADKKGFSNALGRLWVRWSGFRAELSFEAGREVGGRLKGEYDEGVAGELSAYLLDQRLHLRNTRDYLRMRGWLLGTIENLRRKSDWESREAAATLDGNLSSIVLRCLHNADVGYAAAAVAKLPSMIDRLDRAIERLDAAEPEASHLLRKNRSTILTHALHSGYLDYPEQAAMELPRTLKELNQRIDALEASSPEESRSLRSNIPSLVYRALTSGKLIGI